MEARAGGVHLLLQLNGHTFLVLALLRAVVRSSIFGLSTSFRLMSLWMRLMPFLLGAFGSLRQLRRVFAPSLHKWQCVDDLPPLQPR